MVICLERGADLHMAQLMSLPLAASCFSKIQIGFTVLLSAHLGSPGQRAVKWVCVRACVRACMYVLETATEGKPTNRVCLGSVLIWTSHSQALALWAEAVALSVNPSVNVAFLLLTPQKLQQYQMLLSQDDEQNCQRIIRTNSSAASSINRQSIYLTSAFIATPFSQ